LGYSTVRSYCKMPGFPMLKGFVYPRHYHQWVAECIRSQSVGATVNPSDHAPPPQSMPSRNHSDRPPQARRMLKDAGIRG
jgi:hypothetical protein